MVKPARLMSVGIVLRRNLSLRAHSWSRSQYLRPLPLALLIFIGVVASRKVISSLIHMGSLSDENPVIYLPVTLSVLGSLTILFFSLVLPKERFVQAWWVTALTAWMIFAIGYQVLEFRQRGESLLRVLPLIVILVAFVVRTPSQSESIAFLRMFVRAVPIVAVLFSILVLAGALEHDTWAPIRISSLLEDISGSPWLFNDPWLLQRWSTPFGNANLAGTLASVACVLALFLFHGKQRIFWSTTLVLLVFFSQSRLAMSTVILSLTAFILLESTARIRIPKRILPLIVVLALAVPVILVLRDPLLGGRLPILAGVMPTIERSPLFGSCLTGICELPPLGSFTHSAILEPLARYGVVLLVPLLTFLGVILYAFVQSPRKGKIRFLFLTFNVATYLFFNYPNSPLEYSYSSILTVICLASLLVTDQLDHNGKSHNKNVDGRTKPLTAP